MCFYIFNIFFYFCWLHTDLSSGYPSRVLGFSLYVSNSTKSSPEEGLCFKDTFYTKETVPVVFSQSCFVHGQYVIFYIERLNGVKYPDDYSEYAFSDLCEVEVYGMCIYPYLSHDRLK